MIEFNDINRLLNKKTYNKIQVESETQKTNLWLPKGKGDGGINQEFGININTLLYIKQKTNKDLLEKTGNYTYIL